MTKSQRKKLKDTINQLAVELAQISRETDDAVYEAKWYALYNAVHSFFSSFHFFNEDSFQEAILLSFQKFDPEKSSFMTYLETAMTSQRIDAHRKIYGRVKKDKNKAEDKNNEPESKNQKAEDKNNDLKGQRIFVSIETPVDNSEHEGTMTFEETLKDESQLSFPVEDNQTLDSGCYELASQILNFAERHNKKNGSSTKLNYFKLFYTSGMTSLMQEQPVMPEFTHTDEMTAAMKFPFVDYCMVQYCRTFLEIFNGDLRLYGEVVENAPDSKASKPIPTPIPDIVGRNYLSRVEGKKVSPSTYSEQLKAYHSEMHDALQRCDVM
jgi:DNA-directed RNA polymerase specialized sigma24 family protein